MKRRYSTRSTTAAATLATPVTPATPAKRSRQSIGSRKQKPKEKLEENGNSKRETDSVSQSSIQEISKNIDVEEMASSSVGEEKISTTTIDKLPNTILVQIFEMLSLSGRIRVERVCRRWNSVGRYHAWSHTQKIDYTVVADDSYPTVSSIDDDSDSEEEELHLQMRRFRSNWYQALRSRPRLTNCSLRQLLDRSGAYLRSIDLSAYRDQIDYRVLRFIGQQCPHLESINLTGVLVTNTSLRSLATGCPNLKSVTFQRCFHESVVDRGLSCLLASCHELTALNLSENERVSGQCFDDLPPTVKRLELAACYELKNEAIKVSCSFLLFCLGLCYLGLF